MNQYLISRPNAHPLHDPPLWVESVHRRTGLPNNWTDNLTWAGECTPSQVRRIRAAYKARRIELTVISASERPALLEANRVQRYERARIDAIAAGNLDALDKLDRQCRGIGVDACEPRGAAA